MSRETVKTIEELKLKVDTLQRQLIESENIYCNKIYKCEMDIRLLKDSIVSLNNENSLLKIENENILKIEMHIISIYFDLLKKSIFGFIKERKNPRLRLENNNIFITEWR